MATKLFNNILKLLLNVETVHNKLKRWTKDHNQKT